MTFKQSGEYLRTTFFFEKFIIQIGVECLYKTLSSKKTKHNLYITKMARYEQLWLVNINQNNFNNNYTTALINSQIWLVYINAVILIYYSFYSKKTYTGNCMVDFPD